MEIEFDVELKPVQRQVRPTGRSRRGETDVPKLTMLLVLAHQIERAIEEGRAEDYAEVARQLGVSRARITQVVNLLLLSPGIQAAILTELHLVHDLSERQVRKVTEEPDWHRQQVMFDDLLTQTRVAAAELCPAAFKSPPRVPLLSLREPAAVSTQEPSGNARRLAGKRLYPPAAPHGG